MALTSKAHGRWATRINIVILFSALGIYTYRDVWPLATYEQRPADESEGAILIYKIAILAFTAVVIPLFVPRVYTPIDPNVSPHFSLLDHWKPKLTMTRRILNPLPILSKQHLSSA